MSDLLKWVKTTSWMSSKAATEKVPPDVLRGLVAELDQVRASLSDVLGIIDSPEMGAEASIAWLHGCRVDEGVARRNREIIEEAYRLLGRERPL